MAPGPKYDKIGIGYNSTRVADPELLASIIRLWQPQTGRTHLDVGCGTGNYTIELAKLGVALYGIDPSETMLDAARNKSNAIGLSVNWMQGSAESIPLPNNAVSGCIATLTLHHWTNLEAGFRELARVCTPDSRLLIFTSDPEQMRGYWLNHYFPTMLEDSIAQMPALPLIEKSLQRAGWRIQTQEPYFVQEDLQDLFLYAGKQRPHMYFDANFRAGISSFADLANQPEVNAGLARLRSDLDSGRFPDVMDSFDQSLGDYLFILAELNPT